MRPGPSVPAIVGVLTLLLAAPPASARGPGARSATPVCSVDAPGLSFQSEAPGDPSSWQAEIVVDCARPSFVEIALDAGRHAVGNTRQLSERATGLEVPYRLFQDAGRARPWGAGDPFGPPRTVFVQAGRRAIPVYVELTGSGSLSSGQYSDQVLVTLRVAG